MRGLYIYIYLCSCPFSAQATRVTVKCPSLLVHFAPCLELSRQPAQTFPLHTFLPPSPCPNFVKSPAPSAPATSTWTFLTLLAWPSSVSTMPRHTMLSPPE